MILNGTERTIACKSTTKKNYCRAKSVQEEMIFLFVSSNKIRSVISSRILSLPKHSKKQVVQKNNRKFCANNLPLKNENACKSKRIKKNLKLTKFYPNG